MSTAPVLALPAPRPSEDSANLIRTLWPEYQANRKTLRHARARLKELGPQLGRLFEIRQAELATAGRGGEFHPWLRSQRIPRSTAYSLIARFGVNAQKRKKLNCPLDTSPGMVLNGRVLTMFLSCRQAHLYRLSAKALRQQKRPAFNAAEEMLRQMVARVDGPPRIGLENLLLCRERGLYDDDRVPSPQVLDALPAVSIPLGQTGYDYCMTGDDH